MKVRNTSPAPTRAGSVLTFAGSPNQTATAICGVMPQNVMSLYSVDVPVFAATTCPFGSAASVPVPSELFTTVFMTSTAAWATSGEMTCSLCVLESEASGVVLSTITSPFEFVMVRTGVGSTRTPPLAMTA